MSKRLVGLAAMAVLTLASSVSLATLYMWNDAKRPQISLAEALTQADKMLGEDAATYYCVSAMLYGDKTGEGKEGNWNLIYAAANGSKKLVYIDMHGKGHVDKAASSIAWAKHERRTSLAEVQTKLVDFFKKEHIKAEIESKPNSLLVNYRTRDFQVYPLAENGGYEDKLRSVLGPEADGFWLHIQVVDERQWEFYNGRDDPYWNWHRKTYFLTEEGKYLLVYLRYGVNLDRKVVNQLFLTFGEQTDVW